MAVGLPAGDEDGEELEEDDGRGEPVVLLVGLALGSSDGLRPEMRVQAPRYCRLTLTTLEEASRR